MSIPASHPLADGRTTASPVVRAYRGEQPTPTPVWFPGQRAGDAVLFPGEPLQAVALAGVGVRDGTGGPFVDTAIRTASDVLALRPLDPATLVPIELAVAELVAGLGATPLIGVAAAPFTLAALLVEGGPSPHQVRARAMMYADPHAWAGLLNWCADVTGAYLRAQVIAGASAALLADPAMGSLSRRDYQRRVGPHTKRAFDALRGLDVPRVHAGHAGADVLDVIPGVGATVVGVDWRLPLDEVSERLGGLVPLQGNLDPRC